MTEQQLRDPSIEPTSSIMAKSLGLAYNAYMKFIEELKNRDIQVEWRYYKDGKAWLGKALYKWTTIRGTQKEMTACWLSIWKGFFRVSLFIPEKARADVLSLKLSDEIRIMIENSKQMGKLKFFPLVFDLESDKLFEELYTLIDFRKMLG